MDYEQLCEDCGFDSAVIALSGTAHGIETSANDMMFVKLGGEVVAAEVMLHVQPQPKISDCGFDVIVCIFESQAAHTWAPSNHFDIVPIEEIIGPGSPIDSRALRGVPIFKIWSQNNQTK